MKGIGFAEFHGECRQQNFFRRRHHQRTNVVRGRVIDNGSLNAKYSTCDNGGWAEHSHLFFNKLQEGKSRTLRGS